MNMIRGLISRPAALKYTLSNNMPLCLCNRTFSAQSQTQKHKTPWKRASSLLHELRQEEYTSLKGEREWPNFSSGDSIQIDHLPNMSSNDPDKIRGIVISKTNRAMDSSVILLNNEQGTPVERSINIYSPLITNISIIEKAAIHRGRKRVRRSKLYYLRDRRPEEYTVAYDVVVQKGKGKKKTTKKK
jgi:large subunit ribosomal protein L19